MSDPVTRLNAALEGRYRIERELGEGGMATVYLARDQKHKRNVALKVLKPELSAVVGAERFLAEIETTANLQHPNILPLFDSGEADGFLYYVMPYVEGETLRERIDREKQLPVEEGVRIARAVAAALDYAHRQSVVHRDIKPGNILLQDGQPVVSDFGIALAVGAAGGGRLTETGLSVGTPYYMSPEQATGDQTIGAASDTYALACVLYEMLVGEPPYLGNTAQAVLGKIIQGQPVSATAARKSIPANVDAAIRKGLEKLPADRFTSAQDFARALADPGFRHGEPAVEPVTAGAWKPGAIVGWGTAAILAGALLWTTTRPAPPPRVGRFAIAAEDGTAFTSFANILPDGSGMIYRASGVSGQFMLWIRRWDETSGVPIRGTEGASITRVTVSPDGLEVAFSQGFPGPLRVAPLLGGTVRTIADNAYGGGVWSADGQTIYFCDIDIGISRVSASGGEVEQLLLREGNEVPFALIRDDEVLLLRRYGLPESYVEALRLATGEVTQIVEGSSPIALTEWGHLVFGTEDGAMMAAPFDAEALAVTAAPTLMIDGLATNAQLHAAATVSRDGSLLYLPGSAAEVSPAWVSREGNVRAIDPEWRFRAIPTWSSLALSPDAARLVYSTLDDAWNLWMKELDAGPLSKFTFEGGFNRRPSWSGDGETVFFLSTRGGNEDLWSRPADGSRAAELVLDRDVNLGEAFLVPGEEWIVFRTGTNNTADLFVAPEPADAEPTTLVASERTDWEAMVSPDGRWLAYSSDESGQFEVYVRPFPDAQASRQQVSVGGGREPVWARSGGELFYRGPTHYMAATVATDSTFQVRERAELFPVDPFLPSAGRHMYDVHPDGDRFVMLTRGATVPTALVLVQNWAAEVAERLGG